MRMVVGLLGAEKNFVLSGKDRGNVFTSFVRTAGNRLMRSQMTDREPFMKKECGGVRIGEGVWINLGENGTPYNLGRVVHEANAAFNKRLDEEIAKAVEEFRENVLDLARSDCNCNCRGAEAHYKGCPQLFGLYLCAEIRALPTEPEEK